MLFCGHAWMGYGYELEFLQDSKGTIIEDSDGKAHRMATGIIAGRQTGISGHPVLACPRLIEAQNRSSKF